MAPGRRDGSYSNNAFVSRLASGRRMHFHSRGVNGEQGTRTAQAPPPPIIHTPVPTSTSIPPPTSRATTSPSPSRWHPAWLQRQQAGSHHRWLSIGGQGFVEPSLDDKDHQML